MRLRLIILLTLVLTLIHDKVDVKFAPNYFLSAFQMSLFDAQSQTSPLQFSAAVLGRRSMFRRLQSLCKQNWNTNMMRELQFLNVLMFIGCFFFKPVEASLFASITSVEVYSCWVFKERTINTLCWGCNTFPAQHESQFTDLLLNFKMNALKCFHLFTITQTCVFLTEGPIYMVDVNQRILLW